jgi:hypothetical protein
MAKPKGSPKTGGRQAGTPNKLTSAFKTAVLLCYDRIGGDDAFAAWAADNPTEYYKIAARLIPHEVVGPGKDGAHLVTTVQHIHETPEPDA